MYNEEVGDLFDYKPDNVAPLWKVVPTNCNVDNKGRAVMGAGVAGELARRWPEVKYLHGVQLLHARQHPKVQVLGVLEGALWIVFPTKQDWKTKATLTMIGTACWELSLLLTRQVIRPHVVMPQVGCGCGGLKWSKVKPLIEPLGNEYDITILTRFNNQFNRANAAPVY